MKSKNNAIKKFFSIAAVFILTIVASFSVFHFNIAPAFSASIENPDFSSYMSDSTSTPSSPSSYTFVDSNFKSVSYNPQSTSATQPNITAGVINIESEGYSKRSSGQDNFALMISSKKGDSSQYVNYGYTSSQFTLNSESCYCITVDVYVDNADGLASLFLVDENNDAFASYQHIGRSNGWTTYMFLVKTSNFTSYNLKLAMFLDGNGTVLFDSINIDEITNNDLNNYKNTYASTYSYVEPKSDNIVAETNFNNSTFHSVISTPSTTVENSAENDGHFSSSVKIANSQAGQVEYSTEDDFFTFEQNRVYRVTITAKATDLSGKINLRLVQTSLEQDEDGNDIFDTDNDHILTISSNTSSTLNNGFVKYSFYVNAHPLKTTKYKLVVEMGSADNATKGTIYLAGAVVNTITYSNYESSSTGDTIAKINIANKVINVDSSAKALYVTNGNFNTVKTTDSSKPYPTAPDSWTVTAGEHTQLYGVVNTDPTEFNKFINSNSFTSSPVNPGSPDSLSDNNNVLMLYNSVTDKLIYTSAKDKTLEANTYHRFSINVLTQHSTVNLYLVATINEKEVVLSSIKGIATDDEWHNVDLYIHTGLHQLSVGIKVEMNSTSGYGYAYLDDATFDFALRNGNTFLNQPTEADFNAVSNSKNGTLHISKIDLADLIYTDSNSRYSTPLHFDFTSNNNIDFGVIDISNEENVNFILNENQNTQSFKNVDNTKILGIHALDYVNESYLANIGYRFESNKYYLVKVKIYTQNLSSESEKFGLGLSLTGFDEKFVNINTEQENLNGWTTYSFYINPTDTTSSMLKITFGSDDANLKGDAFIADITASEIDSADFVETSNSTTLVLKTVSTTDGDNNNEDNTTDSNKTKSNNTAWIIAIPTILTAAAIILAVVGITLRKVKFKKRVKKTKHDYDRNSKQSEQIYMRKATTLREERLHELNKQLNTLQNERAQYEEQYKKDLSTLRQLKIKRAPANEIAKLDRDMNQNQKHTAQIGSSIRNVELEIEQAQTNEYLKQIVKKLASAKQDEQE